jgi:hypothetical protein
VVCIVKILARILGRYAEERLDIIFGLIRSNSIYDRRLLISLLLPKTTGYVNRLNQIGLIRQELHNLNMIRFSFNNEIVCLMTRSAIK